MDMSYSFVDFRKFLVKRSISIQKESNALVRCRLCPPPTECDWLDQFGIEMTRWATPQFEKILAASRHENNFPVVPAQWVLTPYGIQ
jgi:hypothetical protein